MQKTLLIIILFLFSSVAQSEDVLIDIPALVGKNKLEVSTLIGKPLLCIPSTLGEKCFFKKADSEIIFIEGKADWIKVNALDNQDFTKHTISTLGFKTTPPSFVNTFSMQWESLPGIRSASVFMGEKNSDYAYIKAYTK